MGEFRQEGVSLLHRASKQEPWEFTHYKHFDLNPKAVARASCIVTVNGSKMKRRTGYSGVGVRVGEASHPGPGGQREMQRKAIEQLLQGLLALIMGDSDWTQSRSDVLMSGAAKQFLRELATTVTEEGDGAGQTQPCRPNRVRAKGTQAEERAMRGKGVFDLRLAREFVTRYKTKFEEMLTVEGRIGRDERNTSAGARRRPIIGMSLLRGHVVCTCLQSTSKTLTVAGPSSTCSRSSIGGQKCTGRWPLIARTPSVVDPSQRTWTQTC